VASCSLKQKKIFKRGWGFWATGIMTGECFR